MIRQGLPALLVLAVSIPWPTLPGQGLSVTLNLMVWLWCALCCGALLVYLRRWRLQGGRVTVILSGGLVLMALPLLWTPEGFHLSASWRLLGLATFFLFFWLLLQCPLRGQARKTLYGYIVLAAGIQAVFAGIQVLFPAAAHLLLNYSFSLQNGRPVGTLLQVNLLGSFLATGLLSALWLFLSYRHGRQGLRWLSAVLLLSAALMMTESRAAIAGAVMFSLMLLMFARGVSLSRRLGIVAILIAGGLLGQASLHYRPAQLLPQASDTRPTGTDARLAWNRQHSNQERKTMLLGSVAMIAAHPLAGSGLSTFEAQFPYALAGAGHENPFTVTVTHPHNEIAYVWAEGGVAALVGLLLWGGVLALPFVPLVTRIRRWKTACRGVLFLPLVLHILAELPVYVSAVHGLLLVVLLRLALPVRDSRPYRRYRVGRHRRTGLILAGSLLCVAGGVFMVTGLQSASKLQEAERFRLMDPTPLGQLLNPYAQSDRLLFDQAVSDLMAFNLTQDPVFIRQFHARAGTWLSRHNDANLTATLLQITLNQRQLTAARYWQYRGCLSFPRDQRFRCQSASSFTFQEKTP
ncbi:O-antigen ligase family protein [Klebsiella aerogenes]